jgi:aquaporin NIP|tara:strand:- start:270 stop:929 length:660 start_codon:yes stop_codon:yes gene_type:complete
MKNYIAEIIGTFSMIFCGCGAMVINDFTGGTITHPGVAITWGLIVMAMIYAFGDISGAHFNPAVTVGFAVAKKFKWNEVPKYIVSQFIGAMSASLLLFYLFPESDLGATLPSIEPLKVFVIELLLSFFLMVVIINVSTGSKEIGPIAGIAIGSVILLEAMFAGPLTKASMNPIRSLAPALALGNFTQLWVYLTAPFVGMFLAVYSCKLVKSDNCCDEKC